MNRKLFAITAAALLALTGAAGAKTQAHAGLFDQGGDYYNLSMQDTQNSQAPDLMTTASIHRHTPAAMHRYSGNVVHHHVNRVNHHAVNPLTFNEDYQYWHSSPAHEAGVPADNPRNEGGLGMFDMTTQ